MKTIGIFVCLLKDRSNIATDEEKNLLIILFEQQKLAAVPATIANLLNVIKTYFNILNLGTTS